MRTLTQFTPQSYYKKMEVPNKLVKKTNYACINEFFVPFSWSSLVSANVISRWASGARSVPSKYDFFHYFAFF